MAALVEILALILIGLILIGLLVLAYRLAGKKWQGSARQFMTMLIFLGFCLGLVGILVGGCFLVIFTQ
jgi:hypothetical protein